MPEKLTSLQHTFVKEFVLLDESGNIIFANKDQQQKYEKLFLKDFFERTKTFSIPSEYFHKNMRNWLDSVLSNVPYANVFNNQKGDLQQELDTYQELVNIPIQKMEWGVVQKAISMILTINPSFFKIDELDKKKYLCLHTDRGADSLRLGSCTICSGLGWLEGRDTKPTEERLHLLNYYNIVESCKKIQKFIFESMETITNEVIENIWFNKMNDRDRYNAEGEIAKIFGKQKQAQIIR